MPRYDYKCTSCEQEFELVQSFNEAGSGICPSCSGKGQRVYHAVPVIYKGSGFYTTDYGRPKQPSENGAKETKDSKDSQDSKSTGDNKESGSSSSSGSKEKVSASENSSSGSSSNSGSSDASS